MKTIITHALYLQSTALLLTTALAIPAAAQKEIPFHGSIEAVEAYEVNFPIMLVDSSGSGNATHFGRFAVTYRFTVDLLTGDGVGSHEFIAANGDSLYTESTAISGPTDIPDTFLVVESHMITGGTGRFEGASGSFTLERLVSVITGVTSGSFNGTIVLDKGK